MRHPDEIIVKVNSYGPGRPLGLVYFDPITGKKKAKSSGTTDWREAERLAGELERELRAGRGASPSKITWKQFREQYEAEKAGVLSIKTIRSFRSAANHLEQLMGPDRLCKLTTPALSQFQSKLRKEGMKETTIGSVCRHLKAALGWGVMMGMLPEVPKMVIPKAGGAKSRAVTGEEFDRMLEAVPKVRPQDAAVWAYYLRGLLYSGLRLEESLSLSWDEFSPFGVDLTGPYPAFRIESKAQKSRKDERLGMTDEFYDLLMETPPADRVGKVFKLNGLHTHCPINANEVSKIVGDIGKAAGVVVAVTEKKRKVEGKLVTTPSKKFASAHDLRRAFATRWAKRVPSIMLQRLMRHASLGTTDKYYVTLNADEVTAFVWRKDWNPGNNLGNRGVSGQPAAAPTPADESAENVDGQAVMDEVRTVENEPT